MKKYFLFFASALLFSSCGTSEKINITDYKSEAKELSKILSDADDSSQKFEVSATAASAVKGKNGMVIHIDPKNLESDNGKPLGETIQVELKELLNSNDFFKAGAPSTSNGKMLLSGGEYFIGMTSGGNNLRVKRSRTIDVDFPRISTKRMELFTADRDSLNRIDWFPSNQKFKKQDGTENYLYDMNGNVVNTYDDKALADKYETMSLKYIGWVACAAFNRMEVPMDLEFSFTDTTFAYAETFLIFKDIPCTMQKSAYFNGKDQLVFEKIPFEAQVKLVAIATKNGKLYSYSIPLKLGQQDNVKINLKETDSREFRKILNN